MILLKYGALYKAQEDILVYETKTSTNYPIKIKDAFFVLIDKYFINPIQNTQIEEYFRPKIFSLNDNKIYYFNSSQIQEYGLKIKKIR